MLGQAPGHTDPQRRTEHATESADHGTDDELPEEEVATLGADTARDRHLAHLLTHRHRHARRHDERARHECDHRRDQQAQVRCLELPGEAGRGQLRRLEHQRILEGSLVLVDPDLCLHAGLQLDRDAADFRILPLRHRERAARHLRERTLQRTEHRTLVDPRDREPHGFPEALHIDLSPRRCAEHLGSERIDDDLVVALGPSARDHRDLAKPQVLDQVIAARLHRRTLGAAELVLRAVGAHERERSIEATGRMLHARQRAHGLERIVAEVLAVALHEPGIGIAHELAQAHFDVGLRGGDRARDRRDERRAERNGRHQQGGATAPTGQRLPREGPARME